MLAENHLSHTIIRAKNNLFSFYLGQILKKILSYGQKTAFLAHFERSSTLNIFLVVIWDHFEDFLEKSKKLPYFTIYPTENPPLMEVI